MENLKNLPVLAVCYDFDRTLTPDEMQAQGYIQSVGCDVAQFWREANSFARQNDMDGNLAYMFKMAEKAAGNFDLTRAALNGYGARVRLYKGVKEWFGRINAYGLLHGVKVEHYIISSGLKEMIEGTEIAGEFAAVYASAFYYGKDGVAVWPAQVVNYTTKTQFLFRIQKGVTDINDGRVNEYFPPEKLHAPFRNIVYIGDSDTDIPCMKLVNVNGGHSIGVYDPSAGDKSKVEGLLKTGRVRYAVPADYSEGGELDGLLKTIIDKTAAYEALERKHIADLGGGEE